MFRTAVELLTRQSGRVWALTEQPFQHHTGWSENHNTTPPPVCEEKDIHHHHKFNINTFDPTWKSTLYSFYHSNHCSQIKKGYILSVCSIQQQQCWPKKKDKFFAIYRKLKSKIGISYTVKLNKKKKNDFNFLLARQCSFWSK